MKELYTKLIQALERGEDAVLCSILTSSGSSPRGAGARMAVFADGSTLGTVGGGAVERLAGQQALEALRQGRSYIKGFCLAPNQVEDIGMICGGNVTLYFQCYRHGDAQALALLRAVRSALDGDENAWLAIKLEQGALSSTDLYIEGKGPIFGGCLSQEEWKPLLGSRAIYVEGEPLLYVEPIARRGRVYLFGGGHVGQALVPVLAKVGFRVTVFDDRARMAQPGLFPGAEAFLLGDYAHIAPQVTLRPEDYVVIMTPGHQADFEVLAQALRTPATYVGCIGSSRKVARTRERLLAQGLSQQDVERVHSPIGLAIGAETPEEIAISIAAEMIAHRAGRSRE